MEDNSGFKRNKKQDQGEGKLASQTFKEEGICGKVDIKEESQLYTGLHTALHLKD